MSKKTAAKDDIAIKLATLAIEIADKASGTDVLLVEKIEAFKVLTTYHVNTTKVNAKRDTEDESEGFNGFRDRIKAASSGSGSGDSAGTGDGEDLFG